MRRESYTLFEVSMAAVQQLDQETNSVSSYISKPRGTPNGEAQELIESSSDTPKSKCWAGKHIVEYLMLLRRYREGESYRS